MNLRAILDYLFYKPFFFCPTCWQKTKSALSRAVFKQWHVRSKEIEGEKKMRHDFEQPINASQITADWALKVLEARAKQRGQKFDKDSL